LANPKRAGDQENHGRSVHGEHHIVGVRLQEMVVRHGELQPDEEGLDAADHKEAQGRDQIQHPDALVVHG
jgi:hypothetical protein